VAAIFEPVAKEAILLSKSREHRMDLILWRHADAEDSSPDLTRNLTAKGNRQARRMARWLRLHLPKHVRILASPANRTRQTADALHLAYEVRDDLAPQCSAQQLLNATGWPNGDGVVVLVGHNPAISELASLLLAGKSFPMTLRKGAAWWFSNRTREDEESVVLKAAMMPAMLKKA
jgi:phosphohistidine phosphatase